MIRTIALVSAKGGGGKTTLAASIAVAAMETGEKPYLIDIDPQASLIAWAERRQAEDPPVDTIGPDRLSAAITGLGNSGFTLAIIDTAGTDTPATGAAMRAADLALLPCRASVLDFVGIKPTLTALMQIGHPYALVLNCCPPGRSTSRLKDAGRALSLLGAFAPPVTQRMDHVDAMGLGLGVTEHDAKGKAAEEIRALWQWINRRIGRKSHAETHAVS